LKGKFNVRVCLENVGANFFQTPTASFHVIRWLLTSFRPDQSPTMAQPAKQATPVVKDRRSSQIAEKRLSNDSESSSGSPVYERVNPRRVMTDSS
jgi:hypothetical protein